jgi:hypothetical protein
MRIPRVFFWAALWIRNNVTGAMLKDPPPDSWKIHFKVTIRSEPMEWWFKVCGVGYRTEWHNDDSMNPPKKTGWPDASRVHASASWNDAQACLSDVRQGVDRPGFNCAMDRARVRRDIVGCDALHLYSWRRLTMNKTGDLTELWEHTVAEDENAATADWEPRMVRERHASWKSHRNAT